MNVLGYLDPASGSLIAATVAGGIAGVGVAAKSVWHKRTARFRRDDTDEAAAAGQDTHDQGSDETEVRGDAGDTAETADDHNRV